MSHFMDSHKDRPLTFRHLLRAFTFDPKEVRLLRHKNDKGRTPHSAWWLDRAAFEKWQSHQLTSQRADFARPYWASFIDAPGGRTLFVGMYKVRHLAVCSGPVVDYLRGGVSDPDKQYDEYEVIPEPRMASLAGRVFVDWPVGRNWRRVAENGEYTIEEIVAEGQEAPYPGHAAFSMLLSEIEAMPDSWRTQLKGLQGIYVLTCIRDGKQYVGLTDHAEGFYGRWRTHARKEGDAIMFRTREPGDYRVGILEVAGSFADRGTLETMEAYWKAKLGSRAFGLNAN